jgi:hypothetical protein
MEVAIKNATVFPKNVADVLWLLSFRLGFVGSQGGYRGETWTRGGWNPIIRNPGECDNLFFPARPTIP